MKKAKVAKRAKSPRQLQAPVGQPTNQFLSAQERFALNQRKRARQNADAKNRYDVPSLLPLVVEAAKTLHKQLVNSEWFMEHAVTLVTQKPLTTVERKRRRSVPPGPNALVFTDCKAWNLGRTGDIDTTFVYLDEGGDIHVIAYETIGDVKGGTITSVKETSLSGHVINALSYSTLDDILRLIELNSKAFDPS